MEIRGPYSYHIATELSGLLRELGEFPCVHQSVGTVMFRAPFAPWGKELIVVSVTRALYEFLRPHMRIKYLNLTESRVRQEDTCRCLADEPVPSDNVKRRAIQRVGMYGRSNYRKSREYCQTCSEGTATTETVRGMV